MKSRLLLLPLLLSSTGAFAGGFGKCSGKCGNFQALERLADAPAGAQGATYENSRLRAERTGSAAVADPGAASGRARLRASVPELRASRQVPPPDAMPEKKESGGLLGFLDKHKWHIAGSVVGTVAGFLLGGGLFGALLGVAIGIGVSFLGSKLFGD